MHPMKEDLLSGQSLKSSNEYQDNSRSTKVTKVSRSTRVRAREEDKKSSTLADKIITAFIVKRRKAIIDQEQDLDLVDYEESEKRLIIMALILASVLVIASTSLLIVQIPNWTTHQVKIVYPKTQTLKPSWLSSTPGELHNNLV